jgi:hypothetical protein
MPIGSKERPTGFAAADVSISHGNADSPLLDLACNPVPTADSVAANFEYKSALLTSSVAGKLGIPFVNVSGARNAMILIRDVMRSKDCLASDGKTRLLYGQTIRSILTITDWSASGSFKYAVVAADATVKNTSHQILVQVIGIRNPKLTDIIKKIAGKDFNVETYGDFIGVESDLMGLIGDSGTTLSVERLGTVKGAGNISDFQSSVATTYAVAQVAVGKNCSEAQASFRPGGAASLQSIQDAYIFFVGACDNSAPSDSAKKQASDVLANLKVKY